MGLSFSGSNSPHDPKMSSKTHDYNHEGSALPPQPGFLRDGCAPFPMAIRGLRHIRMAGTMRIRSRFARRGAAFAAAAVFAGCLCAQADEPGLPHLVRKDGRHALIVDGAPFLILLDDDQADRVRRRRRSLLDRGLLPRQRARTGHVVLGEGGEVDPAVLANAPD